MWPTKTEQTAQCIFLKGRIKAFLTCRGSSLGPAHCSSVTCDWCPAISPPAFTTLLLRLEMAVPLPHPNSTAAIIVIRWWRRSPLHPALSPPPCQRWAIQTSRNRRDKKFLFLKILRAKWAQFMTCLVQLWISENLILAVSCVKAAMS
jgi:hypothetical protein